MPNDDWQSSSKFVLEKLSEHGQMLQKIQDKLIEIQVDMTAMKVKFMLITAAAALIASFLPNILPAIARSLVK